MSKLVKQIERLLEKNQQTKYLAVVISLDENLGTDGMLIKINCEPIVFLGLADLVKENLDIVRDNIIVPSNDSQPPAADIVSDILFQESENIRQGFVSGDVNNALINLAGRLKKAKDETKLDDLDIN